MGLCRRLAGEGRTDWELEFAATAQDCGRGAQKAKRTNIEGTEENRRTQRKGRLGEEDVRYNCSFGQVFALENTDFVAGLSRASLEHFHSRACPHHQYFFRSEQKRQPQIVSGRLQLLFLHPGVFVNRESDKILARYVSKHAHFADQALRRFS